MNWPLPGCRKLSCNYAVEDLLVFWPFFKLDSHRSFHHHKQSSFLSLRFFPPEGHQPISVIGTKMRTKDTVYEFSVQIKACFYPDFMFFLFPMRWITKTPHPSAPGPALLSDFRSFLSHESKCLPIPCPLGHKKKLQKNREIKIKKVK